MGSRRPVYSLELTGTETDRIFSELKQNKPEQKNLTVDQSLAAAGFFLVFFLNQTNEVGAQTIAPVSGGMSASVTISSSSMVVSVVTWSLCGRTGAV